MLFLANTVGHYCLKNIKNTKFGILTKITLGLCIIPYFTFLLGMLNILSVQIIMLLHTSICIVGIMNRQIIDELYSHIEGIKKIKLSLNAFQVLLVCLLLIQVLLNFIMTFSPPSGVDDLMYHFYLPKKFLIDQSINYLPDFMFSAMPQHIEMLWTWCIAIHSAELAQFLNWVLGLLVCSWIYKFSNEIKLNKPSSLIATTFFYSISAVGPVLYTGGVEIGATLFFIASIFLLLQYFKKNKIEYLVLSSIFLAGFCISKLPYFAVASLVIIFTFFRMINKYGNNKTVYYDLFIQCFLVLLFSSNWFVFCYFETGNPVYPWLNSIFNGPLINNEYFGVPDSSGGVNTSFNHFFKAPIRLISQLWILLADIKLVRGSISPLFIALFFISYIFKPWRKNEIIKDILIISGLFYVAWILLYPQLRLGLPMFSIFSIFIANVYKLLIDMEDKYVNLFLKMSLLSFLFVSKGSSVRDFNARSPYLTGKLNKKEFLESDYVTNNLYPYYETVSYVNNNLTKNSKVLLWTNDGFYYERDVVYSHGYLWTIIDPEILDDSELIIKDLISRGITHVVMTENYWRKAFKDKLINSGRLETVFSNKNTIVARILN